MIDGADDGTPGERRPRDEATGAGARAGGGTPRMLDRPPSERFGGGRDRGTHARDGRTAGLTAPLARALLVWLLAATLMTVTAGFLAIQGALLFIAALAGAASGLLLARAVVPVSGPPALTRSGAIRWSITIAVGGVLVGALGIWVVSRLQGGVLDPIDLFAQTSGVLVPLTVVVAAITAAWGAGAGPVQS